MNDETKVQLDGVYSHIEIAKKEETKTRRIDTLIKRLGEKNNQNGGT